MAFILLSLLFAFFSSTPRFIESLSRDQEGEQATPSCGEFGDCLAIDIDLSNREALQRGAALFINNCLGCHSAAHQRYQRVAADLGVDEELFAELLLFGGKQVEGVETRRIGDLMTIAMNQKAAASWLGAPPPDLSVRARVKSPSWIYTYLKAYYEDQSRPHGTNNLVLKASSMPNILEYMQGKVVCPKEKCSGPELVLKTEGDLSPREFDRVVSDLTHFLVYLGEPVALFRDRWGVYVLLFFAAFSIVTFMLQREYQKDYREIAKN